MYTSPFDDVYQALGSLREMAKDADMKIADAFYTDLEMVAEKVAGLEVAMTAQADNLDRLSQIIAKQNAAIQAIGKVLLKEKESGVR